MVPIPHHRDLPMGCGALGVFLSQDRTIGITNQSGIQWTSEM